MSKTLKTLKRDAEKIVVTFAEVFLASLIGSGITGVDLATTEMAVMAGLGSAMSVAYNIVRQWKAELT